MILTKYAIEKPKQSILIVVALTLAMLAFVPMIKIDTDPENMLSENEEVRQVHTLLKDKFQVHDMIVLGVVNNKNENGIFNKASLEKIYDLSEAIGKMQFTIDGEGTSKRDYEGVIKKDLMAPNFLDHIQLNNDGSLQFDWLMSSPPKSDQDALDLKQKLLSNEMYKNTLVSDDGKMLCLYIPLTSKDQSFTIAKKIKEITSSLKGEEEYHMTGLPIAEDTFGIEMFIQMAISAPAAMILIFFLMLWFFKKFKLVLSPLVVAMTAVLCTMGLLIATGNTVHIMSSMIPIFIMPIAVLDSVHILSEFFDKYPKIKDRKSTINAVVKDLYKPMLFTSLTSAVGFASLALTPIPPVKIFGVFVAIGIILAWAFTLIIVPAYIMLMNENSFENYGEVFGNNKSNKLAGFLNGIKKFALNNAWVVLLGLTILSAISIYGISLININDNPVKWFSKNHEIRLADKALNEHFAGSYMAYLNLDSEEEATLSVQELNDRIQTEAQKSGVENNNLNLLPLEGISKNNDLKTLSSQYLNLADNQDNDDLAYLYEDISSAIDLYHLELKQPFKNPEMLNYIGDLEKHLIQKDHIGKMSSLTTIVKKVNKELSGGDESSNKIPNSVSGVGQCILSFQNSHTPHYINHFVSSDYKSANLWMQLKSGDNKDMEATTDAVNEFIENNPPPFKVSKNWFGLTYINVIWQKKMVAGMMEAFLGSFVIVFLMMAILFRSIKWALLSMIPLSFTILFIYGFIGLIGKDYDMPVAVLSALALGLAIDFAIHFLVRSRDKLKETKNFESSMDYMFEEPARAISRNVIVIALGFVPLLFANLVPYKTVGMILASILLLSGLFTLLIYPALMKIIKGNLLKKHNK